MRKEVFFIIALFLISIPLISNVSTSSSFGYNNPNLPHLQEEVELFLPAYISSHTNNTIPVASAGVWYNVTFDNEEDEFGERITHNFNDSTNTTFTIQDSGIYEITYTLTFEDDAASPNAHIVSRVTKNNVELNGFNVERDSSKQYHDFGLSHSDLIGLATGDNISLSFTSDDLTVSLATHLIYGIHKNTGHLTIKRIA